LQRHKSILKYINTIFMKTSEITLDASSEIWIKT
jgi:hypothetical protein